MMNFTYSVPTKIHFGEGQLPHLAELKESGDKVLLVYGGGSIKRSGLYDDAMKIMQDAGLTVDDIDYVNAHATSTPQGDQFEAIALNRLFNGKHALISSTKGMTGHECWMAGASEAVYSILMMKHSFVAPNINFENPDEFTEPLNLALKTVDTELDNVLSNSFGFGGTNSALILKNWK
jgi:3-oxoacyl-[acyl-carrier-protein] synthase-1